MKIKLFFITIIVLLITGCTMDYYENPSFGEQTIDAWFSYVNNKDDLGTTRKEKENIKEIKDRTCKFIEKDKYKRYIFKCKITYTPIGDTIIPLSKDKTLTVYTVFMPNNDNTFDYKVYNSKYKEKIWEEDPDINYNEKR